MRPYSICFFLNLFVCLGAKSQPVLHEQFTSLNPANYSYNQDKPKGFKMVKMDTILFAPFYNPPVSTIPSAYYSATIGFFCKKELQVEKAIKLPLKFRLGSVDYTDKMEGKGTGALQHGKAY